MFSAQRPAGADAETIADPPRRLASFRNGAYAAGDHVGGELSAPKSEAVEAYQAVPLNSGSRGSSSLQHLLHNDSPKTKGLQEEPIDRRDEHVAIYNASAATVSRLYL